MKKLSLLLVLAMLLSVLAALPVSAEGAYSQSPMLDERVNNGELPPVEERLPEVPRVTHEILDEYLDYEDGSFGGTLRLVTPYVNWDSDAFIGMQVQKDIIPALPEERIIGGIRRGRDVLLRRLHHLREGILGVLDDGVQVIRVAHGLHLAEIYVRRGERLFRTRRREWRRGRPER